MAEFTVAIPFEQQTRVAIISLTPDPRETAYVFVAPGALPDRAGEMLPTDVEEVNGGRDITAGDRIIHVERVVLANRGVCMILIDCLRRWLLYPELQQEVIPTVRATIDYLSGPAPVDQLNHQVK